MKRTCQLVEQLYTDYTVRAKWTAVTTDMLHVEPSGLCPPELFKSI